MTLFLENLENLQIVYGLIALFAGLLALASLRALRPQAEPELVPVRVASRPALRVFCGDSDGYEPDAPTRDDVTEECVLIFSDRRE